MTAQQTSSAAKDSSLENGMANALRVLAMDAVQAANSGHPGMPMGMADAATALFTRHLKFDPAWPGWPDRDRFVLSAGHGSMLLYGLLHLTGYADITMEEIRNFRQLGGRCAGHPEYGQAAGIETTTGPLGQGFANAIGMALAERIMAHRFGNHLVDHHTYALVGDGCLMEGISHEAISLAGHLRLSKLIVLFDDNGISIDGPTDLAVSDDQQARFAASGWDVAAVDGHDQEAVSAAIAAAKKTGAPSLIACGTTIAYGAPNKQGSASTHGAPLGVEEIAAARETLGWDHPPFEIPNDIAAGWRAAGGRGGGVSAAWKARLDQADGETRALFERVTAGDLPAGLDRAMDDHKRGLAVSRPGVATRKASGLALEVINKAVPETIGGSADLTGSVNTLTPHLGAIGPGDFAGRYIYYGVREHAMAAVMNGMALHGGIIPYAGTFMIFSDYCRPAIRLSALMGLRVVYVMTHDSIGLGQDGPTHQPIEHLASLRAIPGLNVFRPADAVETAECWALALAAITTPSVLSLTRQSVPAARLEHIEENLCARGAYELRAATGKAGYQAKMTLFATGSEVGIALAARDILQGEGIPTRVVSVPCWELFDAQDDDYRTQTLGPGTAKVAVEAGVAQGWEKFVGNHGTMVGLSGYGASAPAEHVFEHFGLTAEAVAEAARKALVSVRN